MPPTPTWATISYGPTRAPGANGMRADSKPFDATKSPLNRGSQPAAGTGRTCTVHLPSHIAWRHKEVTRGNEINRSVRIRRLDGHGGDALEHRGRRVGWSSRGRGHGESRSE